MGVFSELDIMYHNGESSDRIARFIMSVNPALEYERAYKLAEYFRKDWNESQRLERGEEE